MAMLSGWKYRKKIIVRDAYVDDNLAYFPVYVPIKNDANFRRARVDGHDIRFTLSDGTTLLDYEREHWSGGNGSPATAHFWVKVPSILADGGAIIYCYYGKSDAPDGKDAPNVWDANFKGVWHLKDITPSTVADSTGVNNGTKKAANEPIEADGKVYKGQDCDGLDDIIDCGNDPILDLIETLTLEVCAKRHGAGEGGYLAGRYKVTDAGYIMHWARNSMAFFYANGAGTRVNSLPVFTDDNIWVSATITFDNGDVAFFRNGIPAGIATDVLLTSNPTIHFTIGCRYLGWTIFHFFDGLIDEVRISNIVRTPAYHKFKHHNIFEADNEISWGSEEAIPSKFSSSMRANSAVARKMRSAHVKTTRPSIGTFPRKGYIK